MDEAETIAATTIGESATDPTEHVEYPRMAYQDVDESDDVLPTFFRRRITVLLALIVSVLAVAVGLLWRDEVRPAAPAPVVYSQQQHPRRPAATPTAAPAPHVESDGERLQRLYIFATRVDPPSPAWFDVDTLTNDGMIVCGQYRVSQMSQAEISDELQHSRRLPGSEGVRQLDKFQADMLVETAIETLCPKG